ncbi:hypothetical protein JTB14_029145 [Gonioctena quinquepunctata]|nr:hypothetical protein JTB14_029145 [Gonioctena quinquepunctata]
MQSKFRHVVAWIADVITGKQTELMENPDIYDDEYNKLIEDWDQLDPKSYEIYMKNLKQIRIGSEDEIEQNSEKFQEAKKILKKITKDGRNRVPIKYI